MKSSHNYVLAKSEMEMYGSMIDRFKSQGYVPWCLDIGSYDFFFPGLIELEKL